MRVWEFPVAPGPKLLFLGGVHGNEPCGVLAINRLADDIEAGRLKLRRGTLRMIAPGNPVAFAQNARGVVTPVNPNANENRNFGFHLPPRNNEERAQNRIAPSLMWCNYLVDLHSTTAQSLPHAFQNGDSARDDAFIRALNPSCVIKGWTAAYQETYPDDSTEYITTAVYAARSGAVAVTFEHGQNRDPYAADRAYETMLRALDALGMIDPPRLSPAMKPDVIVMEKFAISDGHVTLAQNWGNLARVRRGETIAYDGEGSPIVADKDMLLVLPKRDAAKGAAAWYPGRLVEQGDWVAPRTAMRPERQPALTTPFLRRRLCGAGLNV